MGLVKLAASTALKMDDAAFHAQRASFQHPPPGIYPRSPGKWLRAYPGPLFLASHLLQ